jgi:chemotaxis protein CheX
MEFEIIHSEVQLVIERIWTSMFQDKITKISDVSAAVFDNISLVAIDGAWKGAMVLATTSDFSEKVARHLFDLAESEDPSEEQTLDVMRELANLIGGNIKTVLPEPCQLSLPQILDSQAKLAELTEGKVLIAEYFEWRGSPLSVYVIREA